MQGPKGLNLSFAEGFCQLVAATASNFEEVYCNDIWPYDHEQILKA